jgi:anti-sigma regulatory factor (Ser/Thr protein kinase)
MTEAQVGDVELAVHELAANAICHGAGRGRMRMWHRAGTVRCRVDDAGAGAGAWRRADRTEPTRAGDDRTITDPWARALGHGLWVAREVADHMEVLSGPHGTRAAVTFMVRRAAQERGVRSAVDQLRALVEELRAGAGELRASLGRVGAEDGDAVAVLEREADAEVPLHRGAHGIAGQQPQ